MSSEASTASRKNKRSNESKPSPEGDHRKRNRNRTTQSCINCHTSKRMCDRRRPACARCVQLGLSGLCVYEIDDPNQQTDTQDESSRLLKRVAELEGVVRELKNRPLPRWVHSADDVEKWRTISGDKLGSSNAPSSPDTSGSSDKGDSWSSFGAGSSLGGSSPGLMTPPEEYAFSPAAVSNRDSGHNYDFSSMFTNYPTIAVNDTFVLQQHRCGNIPSHCGCVQDPTNYKNMLELSVRLRKASDVLNRSPTHHLGNVCPLHQRISDLDTFTTNVLISTSERSPLSDGAHPSFDTYHSMQPFSHPTSPSSGRSIPNGPWDVTLSESSSSAVLGDPLMTWEPLRSAKFHH